MAGPQRIQVYGLLNNVDFQRARFCAERYPTLFPNIDVKGMLEFEWELFIDAKRKELRGETWAFNDKAVCFVGDKLMGPNEFLVWAEDNCNYEEFRPMPLFLTLTEQDYQTTLASTKHDFVYLSFTIADQPIGKLVIELFNDIVPKTCENFKALCTGEKGTSESSDYKLHYKNSLIHRIVKNGWVQGGDIYHSRGNGGESIYGPVFEDENFGISHTKRGIVGMANKGRHTNGSQFYITLQPSKWLDTKYVGFGQIIEGTETLKKIEAIETMNERPNSEIKIVDCGVCKYEF
ncbi:hypothetical protein KUTeg_007504 [Tegillarca granosa]|uniref:Peptidyl-prolyl cis-trans isomerase n=1 Tax=Tegillarca granosa TaxID=220873 RepID=A0ABQ9FDF5_TEGGR|nr:hypothetical protein KUTeg_007504 [Tegillarca granosa]